MTTAPPPNPCPPWRGWGVGSPTVEVMPGLPYPGACRSGCRWARSGSPGERPARGRGAAGRRRGLAEPGRGPGTPYSSARARPVPAPPGLGPFTPSPARARRVSGPPGPRSPVPAAPPPACLPPAAPLPLSPSRSRRPAPPRPIAEHRSRSSANPNALRPAGHAFLPIRREG